MRLNKTPMLYNLEKKNRHTCFLTDVWLNLRFIPNWARILTQPLYFVLECYSVGVSCEGLCRVPVCSVGCFCHVWTIPV